MSTGSSAARFGRARAITDTNASGPQRTDNAGETPRHGIRWNRILWFFLLWTLWGIIQHVNQNPVDDFWAYALNRFERCKTLMGSPDFGRHLQAVKNG